MSRQIVPDSALDILRRLGDPSPGKDAWYVGSPAETEGIVAQVVKDGLPRLATSRRKWVKMAADLVPPDSVDVDKVVVARSLFARYGTEIASALLLAGLPQAYAAENGAKVLSATTQLKSHPGRRISRTANFLAAVMMERDEPENTCPDWDKGKHFKSVQATSASWRLCAALRTYHAAVRAKLLEHPESLQLPDDEVPLNQEDLLGMLLSFTVTVFEVLESYGIQWSTDEQEAYLHLWDLIGARLGIGSPYVIARLQDCYAAKTKPELDKRDRFLEDMPVAERDLVPPPTLKAPLVTASWHGLRPPTIDDSRALLAQIQQRQWRDPGPATREILPTAKPGRILLRALLDELVCAMPARERLLPLTIMRQLNPALVRSRLNLGGSGALLAGLQNLPKLSLIHI